VFFQAETDGRLLFVFTKISYGAMIKELQQFEKNDCAGR